MLSRRTFLSALGASLLAAPLVGLASQPASAQAIYTGIIEGVAVGGYDTVAYHRERAARPGRPDISAEWQGVTWRFVSEDNREAFLADPERYAPAYGGHCAYGVAGGALVHGDPEVFSLVGGRLYLNISRSVHARWQGDIAGYIAQAEENWPRLQ
ncbi:MAG: tat pathway signal sequence domain protein [Hyphomicrobiaceae bacterium]|nr:tat pathway signal sequence domain protein [Hyphomicrobiaceae bacterium]